MEQIVGGHKMCNNNRSFQKETQSLLI